jgi:hypothetical protein
VTIKSFKTMMETESNDPEELLSLLENAWNNRDVDILQYAHIKSDIRIQHHQLESSPSINKEYTIRPNDQKIEVDNEALDEYVESNRREV